MFTTTPCIGSETKAGWSLQSLKHIIVQAGTLLDKLTSDKIAAHYESKSCVQNSLLAILFNCAINFWTIKIFSGMLLQVVTFNNLLFPVLKMSDSGSWQSNFLLAWFCWKDAVGQSFGATAFCQATAPFYVFNSFDNLIVTLCSLWIDDFHLEVNKRCILDANFRKIYRVNS